LVNVLTLVQVDSLIDPSVEEKLPLVQAIVDSHHHEPNGDPKEKNKVRFNVGNNGTT